MLQIQLLYLVAMIATFIVLLLWAKLPSGICLMLSAVVGAILSAIFSNTPFDLRYFIEGSFGYFDTILIIATAMIFIGAAQASGALDYISALLVKVFRKSPALLLIAFIVIIMFPAMVTGSSLASAITTGALVAPIMIKWGIPKAKVGAIVALGAILGMVAPPVNVPAMVICEVVDIAYVNFALPLLTLALPLAIVGVLLLGRKYVKPLSMEEAEQVVDMSVLKEMNWTVTLPFLALILLIVLEFIFPVIFGTLAMPAMFVICTVVAFLTGRNKKLPFWAKRQKAEAAPVVENEEEVVLPEKQKAKEEAPNCVIEVVRQGVEKSLSAMGLLMGVGMFMSIFTLNGGRGYFADLATMIPGVGRYISMAIAVPLFGGISAFGSASILGGPYVMAFLNVHNEIYVTCGLSLLSAIGEFLPPTAMSAKFASDIVEEKSWFAITKAALPALGVTFVYSLFYTIAMSLWLSLEHMNLVLLGFAAATLVAIIFAVIYELILKGRKPQAAVAGATTEESENKEDSAL